ncbi:hypothetical protein ACOBR2_04005 [Telmatobacter bradus]|uniref:hypothetical protein n=1 Tax=Telmatobacter bradus TaxID=474953 RepID=UPI003B4283EA
MKIPTRTIAIDWSGSQAETAQRTHIVVAEVDAESIRLTRGRIRAEVFAWLTTELLQEEKNVVVGLDFSFSFPADFFRRNKLKSIEELWQLVAEKGESWLANCPAPFWGKPGKKRPVPFPGEQLRLCEKSINVAGIQPKSIYQIGGAGSAGTGSLRGMPLLAGLRRAGLAIWPFDALQLPLVVEMYPRLLTGPVAKSNANARRSYLAAMNLNSLPELSPATRKTAEESEDAFDALVSALAMYRRRAEFTHLTTASDPVARLEGDVAFRKKQLSALSFLGAHWNGIDFDTLEPKSTPRRSTAFPTSKRREGCAVR